jgi:hypothetical protein
LGVLHGGMTVVFFVNGDVKRAHATGGKVDYYYAVRHM